MLPIRSHDKTRVFDNVLKCCVFESDYCETTSIDDFVNKYPEKYQFLIGNKSKNEEVMFQGRYSGIGDTFEWLFYLENFTYGVFDKYYL